MKHTGRVRKLGALMCLWCVVLPLPLVRFQFALFVKVIFLGEINPRKE